MKRETILKTPPHLKSRRLLQSLRHRPVTATPSSAVGTQRQTSRGREIGDWVSRCTLEGHGTPRLARELARFDWVSRIDAHGMHSRMIGLDGTSPEAVIRARSLTKVYRMGEVDVVALRGADIDFYRGEFAVLLGASGMRR